MSERQSISPASGESLQTFTFFGSENPKTPFWFVAISVLRCHPHGVRSKTRCNRRFLSVARRCKPKRPRGLIYIFSEVGDSFSKCADAKLPPPTLTCKISGIQFDNKRSVSQEFQRSSEVRNISCRNIFADHPSRAAVSEKGEQIPGKVGMLRVPSRSRLRPDRTWITAAPKVCVGNSSRL
jgi:hypothetical protein